MEYLAADPVHHPSAEPTHQYTARTLIMPSELSSTLSISFPQAQVSYFSCRCDTFVDHCWFSGYETTSDTVPGTVVKENFNFTFMVETYIPYILVRFSLNVTTSTKNRHSYKSKLSTFPILKRQTDRTTKSFQFSVPHNTAPDTPRNPEVLSGTLQGSQYQNWDMKRQIYIPSVCYKFLFHIGTRS